MRSGFRTQWRLVVFEDLGVVPFCLWRSYIDALKRVFDPTLSTFTSRLSCQSFARIGPYFASSNQTPSTLLGWVQRYLILVSCVLTWVFNSPFSTCFIVLPFHMPEFKPCQLECYSVSGFYSLHYKDLLTAWSEGVFHDERKPLITMIINFDFSSHHWTNVLQIVARNARNFYFRSVDDRHLCHTS